MSKTKPVRLVEAPQKMAECETTMRYDVLLNGEFFDELSFNTRGYQGAIPTLIDGRIVHGYIGEVGIATYRRYIAQANREILALEGKS